jgi:hypothetical protein
MIHLPKARPGCGTSAPPATYSLAGPMSDDRKLPAWKKGVDLAHTVYVTVESRGLGSTDAGLKLRRTIVSVPSLLGEAYLELPGEDADRALGEAAGKLAEVAGLLGHDSVRQALPEADRAGLLGEIEGLRGEIRHLLTNRAPGPTP